MMFAPGDKVMRVGSTSPNVKTIVDYRGTRPQFGKVYVVSHCWMTSLGPQCFFVGFGEPPIFHGKATGWMCKYFRKLEEIKAQNAVTKESQLTND